MKTKIVKPSPYFEISMQCSNRKFYEVKNTLWDICSKIDPEQEKDLWNGWMTEKCDYEGDLDSIIIYNVKETKEWIQLIFKEFEIKESIPDGMDIIFTT